jgi:two-component system chemotaxis response regulator CheB
MMSLLGADRTHLAARPRPAAIVVGASAGALDALSAILPQLPAGFPIPIMVVVHLPPDRDSVMAPLLAAKCAMNVREAEDKERLEPATIYIAPPDYHLLVESDHRLSLSSEEPVQFSRPSIDVLFETAADAFGERLVGVVLTGANSDGALGLQSIVEGGGLGLVQRPELAHSSAMPQAALDACASARALSLPEIAAYLVEVAKLA